MRRFGIIGRPLRLTASARYFTAKFENEALDCAFAQYELPSIEALPELLASTPELVGFNVTIPYKQQVMRYVDAISPEAERIGAVNCVRRMADGRLMGYNTDIIGLRAAFDKLLGATPIEHALVLGTGGASQAVQYVLAERGITYSIVSRDAARGNITYADLSPEIMVENQLIINTSPVGMYPHHDQAPDIPYEELGENHFLFDLVYNPERTLFVEKGAARGAHTLSGLDMLYAQAEAAWAIWDRP